MSSRNIRARVAYDGTDFCGWQIQERDRTVQGVIEAALERIHEHPVRVKAAGRTDSGVHARGQVINFISDATVPIERFGRALNSRLPRDVRVVECSAAPEDFHARFSARWREYKYYIEPAEHSDPFSRRFVLTLKSCPSLESLNACARVVAGTHDFSTFSAKGDQSASKIRTIRSSSFYVEDRFIVYRIIGNAFLWKMVRSLVGTMLETCSEAFRAFRKDANTDTSATSAGADGAVLAAIAARHFADALRSKDRSAAGTTAPAKGLVLSRVYYE